MKQYFISVKQRTNIS